MKAYTFLLAMNDVEPKTVQRAIDRAYGRRGVRRAVRTLLIAAALTALFAAAAYAATALYNMSVNKNTETLSQSFGGGTAYYEDIGLVLSFDGPEECRKAGFKAGWLPSEPTDGARCPDGEWYQSLSDEDTEELGYYGPIPYNISISPASEKTSLIIGGRTEIVKTCENGDLQVVEVESDYAGTDYELSGQGASFIILFDRANGYVLRLASSQHGLDVLERMLADMEIYVYMETCTLDAGLDYGIINPGRG